jgi:hypothetical protein
MSFLAPAFAALGAVLSALAPIALLVAAVAAVLFLAWQTNLLGIRDLVSNAFNAIPALLDTLASKFEEAGTLWESTILPAAQSISDSINATVIPVLQSLGPAIQDISEKVFPALLGASQAVAVLWTEKLAPSFQAVADAVGPQVSEALDRVSQLLNGLIVEHGQEVADFFTSTLPNALVNFAQQVGSLGPLLGSVIGFFGALNSVIGSLAQLGLQALQGLFQNVLVPGFEALGDALRPVAPVFDTVGQATGTLASNLGLIGDRLAPLKEFFDNATKGLDGFAQAIQKFQLPDWLRPNSGADLFGNRPGNQGGGATVQPASFNPFTANQGGAPLISIGTIIVSNEAEAIALADRLAAAINNSTKRVNPPTPAQQPGLVATSA